MQGVMIHLQEGGGTNARCDGIFAWRGAEMQGVMITGKGCRDERCDDTFAVRRLQRCKV